MVFLIEQKSLQAGREYTNIKYTGEAVVTSDNNKIPTASRPIGNPTIVTTCLASPTSKSPPQIFPRFSNDQNIIKPPIPPRTNNNSNNINNQSNSPTNLMEVDLPQGQSYENIHLREKNNSNNNNQFNVQTS